MLLAVILVFGVKKLHLHHTFLLFGFLLEDANAVLGIGFIVHIDFLQLVGELMIKKKKKGIVEVDDLGKRAIVGVQIGKAEIAFQVLFVLKECRLTLVMRQGINLW